ncbi:hypothetical protein [Cupriavidus sp. 8B]
MTQTVPGRFLVSFDAFGEMSMLCVIRFSASGCAIKGRVRAASSLRTVSSASPTQWSSQLLAGWDRAKFHMVVPHQAERPRRKARHSLRLFASCPWWRFAKLAAQSC